MSTLCGINYYMAGIKQDTSAVYRMHTVFNLGVILGMSIWTRFSSGKGDAGCEYLRNIRDSRLISHSHGLNLYTVGIVNLVQWL